MNCSARMCGLLVGVLLISNLLKSSTTFSITVYPKYEIDDGAEWINRMIRDYNRFVGNKEAAIDSKTSPEKVKKNRSMVSIGKDEEAVTISVPMSREAAEKAEFALYDDHLTVQSRSEHVSISMKIDNGQAGVFYHQSISHRDGDEDGIFTSHYQGTVATYVPYALPEKVVVNDKVKTTYEDDALIIRLPKKR